MVPLCNSKNVLTIAKPSLNVSGVGVAERKFGRHTGPGSTI
jgi:hypothetical protein